MLKNVKKWVEGPERKYADGVAIFEAAASNEIRKKYLPYFKDVKGEPTQFDPRFTLLLNKVSVIYNNWRRFPENFSHVKLALAEVVDVEEKKETEAKIQEIQLEVDELKEKLSELEEAEESSEEQIDEKNAQIEELEAKIKALKQKRGVSIVYYKDMPESIQELYERVKVITPLMANLHAEVAIEGLHHAKRKKLVKQLIELDDERRSAWDEIDAWAEGRALEEPLEEMEYSPDPLIKGAQMLRRVERLKENIVRSQKAADETDRELIKANALARVAKYQAKLAELEAQLNPEGGEKAKNE